MDSFRCILYAYKRTLLRANDDGKRMGNPSSEHPEEEISLIGKTGGEKTSKHKHWLPFGKETNSEHFDARSSQHNSEIESRILSSVTRSLYSSVSSGQGAMEEDTSYDTEIKLLQPYISVYVWRRTA